jgi:hypothetical protein
VLLDWRVHKQKFVRIFCVVFPEGRCLAAVFPSALAGILGIDGLNSLLFTANTNDSIAKLLCQVLLLELLELLECQSKVLRAA